MALLPYLGACITLHPYFTHLLYDLVTICTRHQRRVSLAICKFRENRRRQARIFLTYINAITSGFTRVQLNPMIFRELGMPIQRTHTSSRTGLALHHFQFWTVKFSFKIFFALKITILWDAAPFGLADNNVPPLLSRLPPSRLNSQCQQSIMFPFKQ